MWSATFTSYICAFKHGMFLFCFSENGLLQLWLQSARLQIYLLNAPHKVKKTTHQWEKHQAFVTVTDSQTCYQTGCIRTYTVFIVGCLSSTSTLPTKRAKNAAQLAHSSLNVQLSCISIVDWLLATLREEHNHFKNWHDFFSDSEVIGRATLHQREMRRQKVSNNHEPHYLGHPNNLMSRLSANGNPINLLRWNVHSSS